MKYKAVCLTVLIVFSASLAIVVGQRLSAEAMAVIVGVVAGVAASIPTSLIIVWVATRSAAASFRPAPEPAAAPVREPVAQPRIVVVQPQPATPQLPGYGPGYGHVPAPYVQPDIYARIPASPYAPAYASASGYAPPPPQRTFTVIGGEALESAMPPDWDEIRD